MQKLPVICCITIRH